MLRQMYAICRRDLFDISNSFIDTFFFDTQALLLFSLWRAHSLLFLCFFSFHFNENNEKCLWLKSLSNLLLLYFDFFFCRTILFLFYYLCSTIVILKLLKSHKSSCDTYLLISFIRFASQRLSICFTWQCFFFFFSFLSILTSICDENKHAVFPLTFGQMQQHLVWTHLHFSFSSFFYFIFSVLVHFPLSLFRFFFLSILSIHFSFTSIGFVHVKSGWDSCIFSFHFSWWIRYRTNRYTQEINNKRKKEKSKKNILFYPQNASTTQTYDE